MLVPAPYNPNEAERGGQIEEGEGLDAEQLKMIDYTSQEDAQQAPQEILLNLNKIQEQTQQLLKNIVVQSYDDDMKDDISKLIQDELTEYQNKNQQQKVQNDIDSENSFKTAQDFITSLAS